MGVIGIPKKTNLIWVIIFTVISIYVLRSIIKSDYGKNFVADSTTGSSSRNDRN